MSLSHSDLAMAVVSGMLVAGYGVIALFFLRFWRDSKDRLFALFAIAFTLLAVQRVALVAVETGSTGATWLYGLRLAAFMVILAAIIDKNRR